MKCDYHQHKSWFNQVNDIEEPNKFTLSLSCAIIRLFSLKSNEDQREMFEDMKV